MHLLIFTRETILFRRHNDLVSREMKQNLNIALITVLLQFRLNFSCASKFPHHGHLLINEAPNWHGCQKMKARALKLLEKTMAT